MNNTHKQPEESGAVLVSVDGTLPSAADVARWSPQNGETWEQAGARYTLSSVESAQDSEEGAE